jgi:acyl carrier protein
MQGPENMLRDCDPLAVRALVEREVRALLKLAPEASTEGRSPIELGLTSLGAMTLQFRFARELGAELPIADILGASSVDDLASAVAEAAHGGQDGGMLI